MLVLAATAFNSECRDAWNLLTNITRLDLIEVCAPKDSGLTTMCRRLDGKSESLGLHNGDDMSRERGYDDAVAFYFVNKPR